MYYFIELPLIGLLALPYGYALVFGHALSALIVVLTLPLVDNLARSKK
jgi:hypothetical protein